MKSRLPRKSLPRLRRKLPKTDAPPVAAHLVDASVASATKDSERCCNSARSKVRCNYLGFDPGAPDSNASARFFSAGARYGLQSSIQGVSNHILKELEPEAHFVTYAPPAFIPFHHQVYLELSMTTALAEPPELALQARCIGL
jgi:hypothetical protein